MIALVRLVLAPALLVLPFATTAHAQADLAPVAPVTACAALADIDMTEIGGPGSAITAAEEVTNAAGVTVCSVSGTLAPSIGFSILLPVETWTQRFLQVGCGGLCGSIGFNAAAASGCVPFETGAFALAASDMGHQGRDPSFGQDPQKRADFAWRGQHLTTLAAQRLIEAYYGQSAEFSYFSGCSDGGREALMMAQRHPDVFDGIIAGAPAANFQVQNGIYHSWLTRANTGVDGGTVLLAPRLPLLHAAVLAACDTIDGQADGLIAFPPACNFDPATLECPADATDTTACLTTAEVATVRAIYDGPKAVDTGEWLTAGQPQFGSELAWEGVFVPRSAEDPIFSEIITMGTLLNVHFPENPAPDFSVADITFDTAFLDRFRPLHPLYDAINPDLSAFAENGGKLILWHGLSDQHISPMNSVAYWQAMESTLGAEAVADFARFYLFPGMYHCGGGDGPNVVDLLTPMLAWVEGGTAPEAVVAALPAPMAGDDHGGPGAEPPAVHAYPDPAPATESVAMRPVFPYPFLAVWDGAGDPALAESYGRSAEAAAWPVRDWAGADLFSPYTPLDQ